MYKVYIENSALIFTSKEPERADGEVLRVTAHDAITFTKLLQKLQFTKKLYVISADTERTFADFCTSMHFIQAGGGVVTNAAGAVLMIFRNGRWDLPKGKLEAGEQIEQCAVREVSEECSLPQDALNRGELITQTYHCYLLHDRWVLKRTTWYAMHYEGAAVPRPQTVEGITRAEWVTRETLPEELRNTYFTIRDVFQAAGYCCAQ